MLVAGLIVCEAWGAAMEMVRVAIDRIMAWLGLSGILLAAAITVGVWVYYYIWGTRGPLGTGESVGLVVVSVVIACGARGVARAAGWRRDNSS